MLKHILKAAVFGFIVFSTAAHAGKIDPAQKANLECRVDSNTASSQDGTKVQGTGNFCVPKAMAKMSAVGEKKLGFEKANGVQSGFMPPPGDTGYAVELGDKYFWAWAVNNTGTTPADNEFRDRFPQGSNVTGAYYVKGEMPAGQLPWDKVIGSKDASVKWAMPGDNAEVVIQIMQAPPGPGYVVLTLEQKNPAPAATATATKK